MGVCVKRWYKGNSNAMLLACLGGAHCLFFFFFKLLFLFESNKKNKINNRGISKSSRMKILSSKTPRFSFIGWCTNKGNDYVSAGLRQSRLECMIIMMIIIIIVII